MLEKVRRRCRLLDNGAVGAEIAVKYRGAAAWRLERIVDGPDDLAIPAFRGGDTKRKSAPLGGSGDADYSTPP